MPQAQDDANRRGGEKKGRPVDAAPYHHRHKNEGGEEEACAAESQNERAGQEKLPGGAANHPVLDNEAKGQKLRQEGRFQHDNAVRLQKPRTPGYLLQIVEILDDDCVRKHPFEDGHFEPHHLNADL